MFIHIGINVLPLSPSLERGGCGSPSSPYLTSQQNGGPVGLDQVESRLVETQWKIITDTMTQMSSLVEGLEELQREVQMLREDHYSEY